MLYNCGHAGCDICGGRRCERPSITLQKFERGSQAFLICQGCLIAAIKFAYDAACTFGGTIINVDAACGKKG